MGGSKASAHRTLVVKHWLQLIEDPTYGDMWISDEGWYQLLNQKCPELSAAFNFQRSHVVKYISELAGPFNNPKSTIY